MFNSIYGILFVCRIKLDWLRPNTSRLDWIGWKWIEKWISVNGSGAKWIGASKMD